MKPNDQFINELAKGHNWAAIVANFLVRQGRDVLIKATNVRPDVGSRHEYADEGDLEIRFRIEVKSTEYDFTCAQDWPFQTMFVDEVYKFDRIPKGKLWAYIIVNPAATHISYIGPSVFDKFIIRKDVPDRKTGDLRDMYACPVEYCLYRPIREEDNERKRKA